jgi:hypothetical protein
VKCLKVLHLLYEYPCCCVIPKLSLQEGYRRNCPPSSIHAHTSLFPAFPDLLRDVAHPILGTLPDPPPICVVYCLNCLLEHPVPPVLGHLSQPDWDLSRSRLLFWFFGLVEVRKDVALLAQEGGLCRAVLLVQRQGEVKDGGGEGEASELRTCQKSSGVTSPHTHEAGCHAHGELIRVLKRSFRGDQTRWQGPMASA